MAAAIVCADDIVDAYLLVRTRDIRLGRSVDAFVFVLSMIELDRRLALADILAELPDCLVYVFRIGSVVCLLRVMLACGEVLAGNLLPTEMLLSVCVNRVVAEEGIFIDIGGAEIVEFDFELILVYLCPFHLAAERRVRVADLACSLAVGKRDVELVCIARPIGIDDVLEILDTSELPAIVRVVVDVSVHISYRFPDPLLISCLILYI